MSHSPCKSFIEIERIMVGMRGNSISGLIKIIGVNSSTILLSILLGVSLNKSFVRGPEQINYRYLNNHGNSVFVPVEGGEPKSYPAFKAVELEEVKRASQRGGMVLLDGRSQFDYENGHIPGAYHLPVADFDKAFHQFSSQFSQETRFIIYCRGGDCSLSRRLAELLYDKGYRQLKIYSAGYNDWFLNHNPVEKGKGQSFSSVPPK
jgi:rhodanese-related sulfurtransferase